MVDGQHAAEDLLEEVIDCASENDKVTLGILLDELGRRTYAPFLIIPPLIEFTPLGGIPGVPSALAALIAIFAVQIVTGVEHIWMPSFVQDRALKGDKLRKVVSKLRGVARWLDDHTGERLPALAGPMAQRFAGLATLVLCCTVPPLELVPFASSAPMAAIALFGLAMLARDGVLMLVGTIGTLGVFSLGVYLLLTS